MIALLFPHNTDSTGKDKLRKIRNAINQGLQFRLRLRLKDNFPLPEKSNPVLNEGLTFLGRFSWIELHYMTHK
jgi:hypothetical protein